MKIKSLILAVIGGIVITLLTGLVNQSPACTRIVCVIGQVYSGYPLAWVETLAGASRFVRPPRLAVDIVTWTIGVAVIMFGYPRHETSMRLADTSRQATRISVPESIKRTLHITD